MTMNRRQFTQSTAAIAAASALPLAHAADVVKIGYVSPQTGPLAPFGEADRWVIDQMKAAFKDGLTIGGKKHDVQIILKDSQSNPKRCDMSTRNPWQGRPCGQRTTAATAPPS